MPVIRVEKTKDYTVMANYHLRDQNLSFKAKGLMSFMLSLPEDWDYTMNGLSAFGSDKIDSIRAAIKELEKNGYVRIKRIRDHKGLLRGTEYTVVEKPIVDEPILDNPRLDKPILGKPILENPMQLSTNLQSTDKPNTKLPSTEGQSTKGKTAGKRPDPVESLPDGVLKESFQGFIEARKTWKAPLTPRAKQLILKRLTRMAPGDEAQQAAILDQSVERGWKGVFPLKDDQQGPRAGAGTGNYAMDEAAAAIAMLQKQEQQNEQ